MTMRESKKKRLAAKGWKVGNATDFPELSPGAELYIELRLKLAVGLKSRRHFRGVTQTQLAKTLRSSQSRVAKMEAGDPTAPLLSLVPPLSALAPPIPHIAPTIQTP